MFKKIKEHFKGKNPYLMASAAIVIVSVAVICLIQKDEKSVGQEAVTATVSTQQSREEIVEEAENVQESGETESSEIGVEWQASGSVEQESVPSEKLMPSEKFLPENAEASEVPESEPEKNVETQAKPEEPVQSTQDAENTSVLVVTPTTETVPEQEEVESPEIIPEPQPEPSAPQEPEIASPEETPMPEETPAPEVTPVPEITPTPEETPIPEVTPSPEETPATHEHSWIFDSWYQEPTCSNGGLVNEICAHCGETQVTGGTPTGEHSYTVESPGDCCSEEVFVCVECNHRKVGEKDPGNHIDVEDGFCYGCGKNTE